MQASIDELQGVFSYDAATGVVKWRVDWHKAKAGDVVGTPTGHGYLMVRYKRQRYYLHRLIWALVTGAWPAALVDHVDMDGENNRWRNLREATKSTNAANRGATRANTSGHKGVVYCKRTGRWRAQIKHEGKMFTNGRHDTPEQASVAYAQLAARLFGEHARVA